jgi:hypothetical protein
MSEIKQDLTGTRVIRLLDSKVRQTPQGAPFQCVRWLAALTAVLVNWIESGLPPSAVAYLPVLTVVALLLLPDAQSIGFAGLRFERLTNEMVRQKLAVDRLCDEVAQLTERDARQVCARDPQAPGP